MSEERFYVDSSPPGSQAFLQNVKGAGFSQFFIDRPIFAAVLSIVITLAGLLAVVTLPIAQYPEITPPTVEVSAFYPGANAQVVADTVAAPIEQQVNGVENMLYMSSQCTNDGTYTLTVTFKLGVDLNMAQVLVQNRESLADPILPDLVKRRGVAVKKKSPSILMIINLFSPDKSRDNLYMSNYATIQLKDELARLPGVGDHLRIGAGIVGGDLDGRRGDVRILRYRQREQTDPAGQRDEDGQHRGEDRAIDEESRHDGPLT